MNTTSLSQFQDAVTLKKDGRRVSLEGVLTGAALGILLIYLVEDVAAAAMAPRGAGPMEGPGEADLGPFLGGVGRIRVAPLEEIDLGLVDGQPQLSGGGGDPSPRNPGGGSEGGLAPLPPVLVSPEAGPLASAAARNPGSGPPDSPSPTPKPPTPEPPEPPDPPEPPPEPPSRELPQLMMVLVTSDESAASRALEKASNVQRLTQQIGIENSSINLRQTTGTGVAVLSKHLVQDGAISLLDDADLDVIASHLAMTNSHFEGSGSSDAYLLTARELLTLALLSDGKATAEARSTNAAMVGSTVMDRGGDNLLGLQADTELTFHGLGDSRRAALAFDLLSQGLRDSAIALGAGADVVNIHSGFYAGAGEATTTATNLGAEQVATDPAIHFQLGEQALERIKPQNWSLKLTATAVGLDNSTISTGSGDDEVSVFPRIEDNLAEDLGRLYSLRETQISRERIGMLRSHIDVGAGNDLVRITGAVIDSTIDLGGGDNLLILDGPVQGDSRILSGRGANQIIVSGQLGGRVNGSSGNDQFNLETLQLAGELDGGAGQDSLSSRTGDIRDLAVIQGPNAGFLGGLQFRSIEGLSLGDGEDVALMSLDGTLSGQLLGGDGLDRLEFSNWELPVTVDLDQGLATGIGNGAVGSVLGFEQVLGGTGDDLLVSSGLFAGLDGQEGDDTLFLRWSPWLSPAPEGLELRGGGGNDRFVIAGLENPIPNEWNGRDGIPLLSDLRLPMPDDFTDDAKDEGNDRLSWLRQVPADGGGSREILVDLTPSGLEGLGDARLLPIAPLEQLLSGMGDSTSQLAIAYDPSQQQAMAELRLLGSNGPGSSRLIAYIPGETLSHTSASESQRL